MELLIGAATDAGLFTAARLEEFRAQGIAATGYGISVNDIDLGISLAYAVDHLATTPDLVVELAKRALTLAAADRNNDKYPLWTRRSDGTIITHSILK